MKMEMSPLIDCIFQLLIFFMLSSTFLTPSIPLSLPTAAAEQLVATALDLTLTSTPDASLLGYNPLALMNSSDATEAAEAKPVYAASQLLMSLAGGSYRAVTYTVNDVLSTLTSTLQTLVNNNGGGSTIALAVTDEISL